MLPVWKLFANKSASAVISLSKDGEILSYLLSKWKYKLIRGSSSKESKIVMQEIVNHSQSNYVLLTPDGPRGPIFKMKPGAVVASHRAGIPLYLIGVRIKLKYVAKKSWDKFCVPLPFSKINISVSEPIFIEQDASREKIDNLILKCEYGLNLMYEKLS